MKPWNPRRKTTMRENRQKLQQNRTNHIQRAQLENECKWEMRNLHENYMRKEQELSEEITMQRQMVRDQHNREKGEGDVKTTRIQQSKERTTMKENQQRIYDLCTSREQQFKIDTKLRTEREDMVKRHTAEMEQLGDPDDDNRQNTLSQRNIKN